VVQERRFRFRDFLRSVEGLIWRVERATTPAADRAGEDDEASGAEGDQGVGLHPAIF